MSTSIQDHLGQAILKFSLLLRKAVDEGQEQTSVLLEHCRALELAHRASLEENEQSRIRHAEVVAILKRDLQNRTTELIQARKLALMAEVYRDRYELVDEERMQLEKRIQELERVVNADYIYSAPNDEIDNIDECPACGTAYLIAFGGSRYECAACSAIYSVRSDSSAEGT